MELVNLDGTIPVAYKGNLYNIPICIWLMDTHPKNAPLCYVKPTTSMSIKVSMFVDQNGKIYLPYLHDWNVSHLVICVFLLLIESCVASGKIWFSRLNSSYDLHFWGASACVCETKGKYCSVPDFMWVAINCEDQEMRTLVIL